MRKTAWVFAGMLALAPLPTTAADVESTAAANNAEQVPWTRWQGRLSLGSTAAAWRLGFESPTFKIASASLMGDYYFGRSLVATGPLGGFRATSGLIFGARSVLSTGQPANLTPGSVFSIGSRLFVQSPTSVDASDSNATLPYLGVGYTGLAAHSGWSFSADLGLVAQNPGNAVRLGRVFNGAQSLDDVIRDMRLAPLLQLGVSYSF